MVTLVNIANTRIYVPEPEFVNLDAARFIYFADERTSRNGKPLAPKTKITLASTYNKTDGFLGSYIFIKKDRRDWALLNSKLIIYARDNPDFRCGWMPSGAEPSIALMCDKKTGVVTNQSKAIPFKSGHDVKINPGCALVVSTDAVGIAASANPSVQFLTQKIPNGRTEPITLQRLSDDGDFSLRFPITQADAPDGTGCAQFEAVVGPKAFTALNIDLRLHRKDRNLSDDPGKFIVSPVEYPLFDIEAVGADVSISGTLDPFDDGTFHADRNYLRLRSRGKSAKSLPTHLFTSRGHRVHLQASDQAKLVLSYSPLRGQLIGGKPVFNLGMYSFTPSGAFEIVTPTAVTLKRQDLVVGAFGTEYLGFVARNGTRPGDELRFDPRQPSFDMTSLHGASPPAGWDPEKNHPLGNASTTAWARVNPQVRSADVAALYVNQPEAAPAFSISELNGEPGRTRLEFDENGEAVNALCPILPLAGRLRAGAALDAAARTETKIVAVERRLQLRSTSSFRTSRRVGSLAGEQWVTTPQGFLARTRGGGGWDALKFAIGGNKTELLIERRKDAGPGPWALQDFLQREDVFAVITDLKCDKLEIGAASLTVVAADWEFRLNLPVPDLDTPPPAVTAAGLSLIIKFRKGLLTELVEKEGEWAGARFLNSDDPVAARKRVLGQISEIRKRSADTKPGIPDLYAPIINDRIDDKEWMGVIVFDALAPPDGFPDAVKALAGGLDRDAQGQPKPLQVPAIGVDRNRIAKGGSGAEIAESTVFAIIDYARPEKEQEKEISSDVGRSWSGFRVEQLRLLIQNSAVDSFYARMKLRVGKLFGGDLAYDSAAGAAAGVYEIHGTYERRVVNGESKDVYTFVGTEPRTWVFRRGAPLLTQIDVKRVKLTSDVTNDVITGRFAISGALSFNKDKFSALGVSLEKVEFADAAVEMVFARSGGPPKFGISVGACRVELGADAGLGKLFKDMPFKLSGLLVGGEKGFKLPELSFLQFDGGDTQLAFGLDFTLDAGFFGRMVSAAKSLNLRIAFAWPSFEQISGGNWLPALGVRFDGGSGPLEIGLQGVLRFSAKMMKTIEVDHDGKRLFLIELLQCTFEVLGRKFPQPGNGDLCLYIYAPAGQGGAVGWFGDIRGITSGSFELTYFGAGQRVYPPGGDSSFRSTKQFVEYVAQQNKATKTRGKANKLPAARGAQSNLDFMKKLSYDPRAGWLVAGQAKIADVIGAYLAFADMPDGDLYGLRVEIPNGGDTFMVDAMYRRLADDLGVFSIEFSVPKDFRTWDVGAATVVIGNLGLEVYTNGDWRFDLGFPRGQDYTRSFQVQLVPFIGWGGAYIAQKSARTSTMLPGCDPVVEMGFALRVGLGKEIRRGPFAAGASISVYGVFEGAVGKRPVKGKRVTYIRVIGRAGIIAEIFGAIDFGIVRAAVGLCAWAEMGVDLETGKDIILFIEAGVSVYVVVVIARIRIWRSEIEITVSFSYSTQISYQWTIPAQVPGGRRAAGYSGERIKWDSTLVIEPDRPRLPLTFAFDAAISANGSGPVNRVSLVPMTTLMGQDGGVAAGRLALALFRWALKSDSRSLTSLTAEEFDAFAAKIEQPDSLSRGSDKPLDYEAISKFLKLNFVAEISAPPPPEEGGKTRTQPGIFVPMPPDLELVTKKGKVWTAADARTLSQTQEKELRKFFDRMALFFRDREVTKKRTDEVPKPSVTMVFEDWIALILKSTVQSARKIFDVVEADARGTQIPLDSVFEKILADSGPAFSMASRFLLHGLRVPLLTAKGRVKDDEPFFDFLRLQIDAELAAIKDAVDPNDKEKRVDIELTAPGAASWIKVDAARPIAQISLKDIADLETILTQAPFGPPIVSYDQVPSARIAPVSHPMIGAIKLKGADNRTLRHFPADLLSALRDEAVPVTARLNAIVETGEGMRRQRRATPLDRRDWAWAATFEVSVRPVAGVKKVYELIGANGASRKRLEILLSSKWRDNMKIHLLRPDGSELNHDTVAAGEVLLVKTNLSVENSPPKTFTILADDETFTADMIADAGPFARLIEQCSIVNSGGFWLSYPHAEQWFSDAFALDKAAKLLIMIEFSSDTLPGTGESAVVPMFVDSMLAPSKDFPIVEIERTDAAGVVAIANVQPGCIVIEATRKNPNHKSIAAAATTYAEEVKTELSARYNLLDYEFANKPKEFRDIEVAQVLPFGPLELDQTPGGGGARSARSEPPKDWRYKIVVPLYRLAVDNGKAEKQRDASPYAAIGTDKIRIALGARDIFGNRLPTRLAPSGVRSLQAKLDGRPISYRYFDRIPPVAEWPGVTIRYVPKDVKKSNMLQVVLAFDKRTITAIKTRIRKHYATADATDGIKQFSAFYHNLRHLLGGPAISAKIQATCGVSAQQDVLDVLRKLVSRICDEVDGAPVSFTLPLGELNLSAFATAIPSVGKLEISFTIERTDFIDPAAARDSSVSCMSYVVAPGEFAVLNGRRRGVRSVTSSSWADFARRFEEAVPGVKFLRPVDQRGDGAAWLAKADFVAIERDFTDIHAYAMSPLSTSLTSAPVNVSVIDSKDLQPRRVVDADMDVLAGKAIRLLEAALNPAIAIGVRAVASDAGDPEGSNSLHKILAAKKLIAKAYSDRLTTIKGAAPAKALVEEATGLAYKRMCADLRNAYDIGAVVQVLGKTYPETAKTSRFLYGEPKLPEKSIYAKSLSLDVARYQRRAKGPVALTFTVTYKSGIAEDQRVFDFNEKIGFEPGLIEVSKGNPEQATAADSYIPSEWLQILHDVPAASFIVATKLPLRRYPAMPKILRHAATGDEPLTSGTLKDHVEAARSWNYRFDWNHDGSSPADTYDLRVTYPKSQAARMQGAAARDELLACLIGLDEARVRIEGALIKPESNKAEIKFLANQLVRLGKALRDYGLSEKTAVAMDAPRESDHLQLVLETPPTLNLLDKIARRADWVGYIGKPGSSPPSAPKKRSGKTSVRDDEGFGLGNYGLGAKSLDVMSEPAAWGSIGVIRNQRLNEAFVYRTPVIRVAEALPARRIYNGWISLKSAASETLQESLMRFIKLLVEEKNGGYKLQVFSSLAIPLTTQATAKRGSLGAWASHPIPSIPPRPINTPGDIDTLVADLVGGIGQWNAKLPVPSDTGIGSPELRFSFTVFAKIVLAVGGENGGAFEMPVLSIPNTYTGVTTTLWKKTSKARKKAA
jgi:hypothetical protein